MSYIALAAPIGPWIEMTLVLCSMLLLAPLRRYCTQQLYAQSLGLTTIAGGIGGILATGMAFSVPALYFACPTIYALWLERPLFFISVISCLALLAGSFGFVVALCAQEQLLKEQQLSFIIGELVYKTIRAQGQLSKAWQLMAGFGITLAGLYTQARTASIPAVITLVQEYKWGMITLPRLTLTTGHLPLYVSVGFITGHVIAMPLLAGLVARVFCIEPLYYCSSFFLHQADTGITLSNFTIAFSSGLVLYGALKSFGTLFMRLYTHGAQSATRLAALPAMVQDISFYFSVPSSLSGVGLLLSIVVLGVGSIVFFSFFNFSFLAQVFIFLGTGVCVYQLLLIAGKIGLAPLGRFATFIMVPGIVLFNFTPVQAILVSAFVEIAGGVACDVLFGQKLALLSSLDQKRALYYQYLGLIVSSCLIGLLFWLLLSHGGIGPTGQFAASKAASRALLINVKQFSIPVLGAGVVFALLVSFTSINSALMLGGILMQPEHILALSAGGMLAYLVREREKFYPFCSGVFTAQSLWMIVKAFLSK